MVGRATPPARRPSAYTTRRAQSDALHPRLLHHTGFGTGVGLPPWRKRRSNQACFSPNANFADVAQQRQQQFCKLPGIAPRECKSLHRLQFRDASTGAGQDLTGLAAVVQLHSRVALFSLRELEQQSVRLLSGMVGVQVPAGAPLLNAECGTSEASLPFRIRIQLLP